MRSLLKFGRGRIFGRIDGRIQDGFSGISRGVRRSKSSHGRSRWQNEQLMAADPSRNFVLAKEVAETSVCIAPVLSYCHDKVFSTSYSFGIPSLKFDHLLPLYSKQFSLESVPTSCNLSLTKPTIPPCPLGLSPLNSQYIAPASWFTLMNSVFARAEAGES